MKALLFFYVAANFIALTTCTCQCAPSQNISSSYAAISFSSPTDNGIGGTPCAPITCSTTIIFVGNLSNGLPAGAMVNILPCQNLNDENTVTLLANNQTFNSCQSEIYKFPITNTNVFTFVFRLTTPISLTVVLQPILQDGPAPTTPQTIRSTVPSTQATVPSTQATVPSTQATVPSTKFPQTTVPVQATTTSFDYKSILADIVIILDGSDTVSNIQQNDIQNILNNALSQFTIDENYLNIAIIVALGDNFPAALVKNTFKSIATATGLKNALTNAYQNSDFSSGFGQNILAMAVELLYNDNFLKTGYRNTTTTQNHLAIYVTTTSSPDPNAINAAQIVLSEDLFQIMAIGYQGGANYVALINFVRGNQGCTIISSDQTAISNIITEKIWNANFNGGNYC